MGIETDFTAAAAPPVVGLAGGPRGIEVVAGHVRIRPGSAGPESWIDVPLPGFRGVTLRAARDGGFEIVLQHLDPSLDVRLVEAPDDSDVIALWRGYGRMIALPLLVEDKDGRLQTVRDCAAAVPSARRKGSPLRARRPRFLARRAAGSAAGLPVHRGERDLMAIG